MRTMLLASPAAKLKSPLSPKQSKQELGKASYEQVCGACHGVAGKPASPPVAKVAVKPTNLVDHRMDSMKDGELYWVVTNGIGKTMPAFKDILSDVERWQVVRYVRHLRGLQTGKDPKAHAHH